MNKKPKPHHHGDLRQALIYAGIELMEEGGIDALTLRKCAARAGVSHAAPAHHFNGVISLKAAIIARGHKIFAQTMQNEMDNAEYSPKAQLQAICKGYLAFSRSNNALFQLMFQAHDVDLATITPSVLAELQTYTTKSYGLLRAASAPFENAKGSDNSTEIMVWSLVHGYATLFGVQSAGAAPSGEIPDFSILLDALGLRLRTD